MPDVTVPKRSQTLTSARGLLFEKSVDAFFRLLGWNETADLEEGDLTDFDSLTGEGLFDGLVSWFKLDETSGTREDIHGPNDLTDNNTVTSRTGKQGNAASFDNANSEYLSISDASQSGLEFGDTDWTIVLWFRNDEEYTSGENGILSKGNGSGDNREYDLHVVGRVGDNELRWLSANNEALNFSELTHVLEDQWYFVMIGYDASANQMRGSVDDGTVDTTNKAGANVSNAGPFQIGRAAQGDELDGAVDEVGVWNRLLTASEITALYNSGNGVTYEDLGGLRASSDAALSGSYGMAVTIEDTTARYGELTGPSGETEIIVECQIDPNTLTMATNDIFTFIHCNGEFKIELAFDGTNYEVRATANLDSGTSATARYDITDASHIVRAWWNKSSGFDDGFLNLYVDGALQEALTGLNNDTLSIDEIRAGAVADLDSGTSGPFYIDNIRWTNKILSSPATTGTNTVRVSVPTRKTELTVAARPQ